MLSAYQVLSGGFFQSFGAAFLKDQAQDHILLALSLKLYMLSPDHEEDSREQAGRYEAITLADMMMVHNTMQVLVGQQENLVINADADTDRKSVQGLQYRCNMLPRHWPPSSPQVTLIQTFLVVCLLR